MKAENYLALIMDEEGGEDSDIQMIPFPPRIVGHLPPTRVRHLEDSVQKANNLGLFLKRKEAGGLRWKKMELYDLLDWRWHSGGRVALDGVELSKASNGSDMT
ncbi:hypothetical protein Y032_0010g1177 [Ancylostoma ceylanicum]|uniref:Uncharacterized protein n=1 Tax=Ancylostoma ceylanicum TaxID=53326 RepID=A0A016VHI9_9BILA|nr:hypothetical protein Y032_0010g1177 [Ancylostoma ceylanicum]